MDLGLEHDEFMAKEIPADIIRQATDAGISEFRITEKMNTLMAIHPNMLFDLQALFDLLRANGFDEQQSADAMFEPGAMERLEYRRGPAAPLDPQGGLPAPLDPPAGAGAGAGAGGDIGQDLLRAEQEAKERAAAAAEQQMRELNAIGQQLRRNHEENKARALAEAQAQAAQEKKQESEAPAAEKKRILPVDKPPAPKRGVKRKPDTDDSDVEEIKRTYGSNKKAKLGADVGLVAPPGVKGGDSPPVDYVMEHSQEFEVSHLSFDAAVRHLDQYVCPGPVYTFRIHPVPRLTAEAKQEPSTWSNLERSVRQTWRSVQAGVVGAVPAELNFTNSSVTVGSQIIYDALDKPKCGVIVARTPTHVLVQPQMNGATIFADMNEVADAYDVVQLKARDVRPLDHLPSIKLSMAQSYPDQAKDQTVKSVVGPFLLRLQFDCAVRLMGCDAKTGQFSEELFRQDVVSNRASPFHHPADGHYQADKHIGPLVLTASTLLCDSFQQRLDIRTKDMLSYFQKNALALMPQCILRVENNSSAVVVRCLAAWYGFPRFMVIDTCDRFVFKFRSKAGRKTKDADGKEGAGPGASGMDLDSDDYDADHPARLKRGVESKKAKAAQKKTQAPTHTAPAKGDTVVHKRAGTQMSTLHRPFSIDYIPWCYLERGVHPENDRLWRLCMEYAQGLDMHSCRKTSSNTVGRSDIFRYSMKADDQVEQALEGVSLAEFSENCNLSQTLRDYQVETVKWAIARERNKNAFTSMFWAPILDYGQRAAPKDIVMYSPFLQSCKPASEYSVAFDKKRKTVAKYLAEQAEFKKQSAERKAFNARKKEAQDKGDQNKLDQIVNERKEEQKAKAAAKRAAKAEAEGKPKPKPRAKKGKAKEGKEGKKTKGKNGKEAKETKDGSGGESKDGSGAGSDDGAPKKKRGQAPPTQEAIDAYEKPTIPPDLTGAFDVDCPGSNFCIGGGIIGDETGLGKTMVATALILGNPASHEDLFWGAAAPLDPRARKSSEKKRQDSSDDESDGSEQRSNEERKKPLRKRVSGLPITKATLLVGTASICKQWLAEIGKWSTKPIRVIDLDQQKDVITQDELMEADLVVMSDAKLSRIYDRPTAIGTVSFYRVIADEAHKLKNPGNKNHHNLMAIKCLNRWLMSGTMATGLEDLHGLVKLYEVPVLSGGDYWKTIEAEKKRGGGRSDMAFADAAPLVQFFRHAVMRHEKNQSYNGRPVLEALPEIERRTEIIKFSPEERKAYDMFAKQAVAEILHFIKSGGQKTAREPGATHNLGRLKAAFRLCQVACSYGKIDILRVTRNVERFEAERQRILDEQKRIQDIKDQAEAERRRKQLEEEMKANEARLAAARREQALLVAVFQEEGEECPICAEEFKDPVQNKCGHIYCRECWDGAMARNRVCPTCRASVQLRDKVTFKAKEAPKAAEPDKKPEADADADGDVKMEAKDKVEDADAAGGDQEHKVGMILHEVRGVGAEMRQEIAQEGGEIKEIIAMRSKIDHCIRMLREAFNDPKNDDAYVIFSQFDATIDQLQRRLPATGLRCMFLRSSDSQTKRAQKLEEFDSEESKIQVLVVSSSFSAGVNLQRGNHVICFDARLNLKDELQMWNRVHRIGQKRKVTFTRLVMEGTVEEQIALDNAEEEKLLSVSNDSFIEKASRAAKKPTSDQATRFLEYIDPDRTIEDSLRVPKPGEAVAPAPKPRIRKRRREFV